MITTDLEMQCYILAFIYATQPCFLRDILDDVSVAA